MAGHLVDANLAGHDSHGVSLIPHYVRHLKEGLVVPNTTAKVVKDDGPFLMFDGQRGFGRRMAGEAMAAAIARTRETGVAVMTLANSHHIGRVGAYGELASAAGLVSIHFVNVADHGGLVAPFRGTDSRFSTNPVCIGMPGTAAIPNIDQKIASMLGTDAASITITDLKVHPRTHNSYVSVMRGQGASAKPALLRVDGAGNTRRSRARVAAT